jgi:hypothetical protein
MGKPKGKRSLEKLRHKWVDEIRMDLGETGWEDVEWLQLAQDRDQWQALVNVAMNLRVLVHGVRYTGYIKVHV